MIRGPLDRKLSPAALAKQVADLRQALSRAADQIRTAETRAAVAEQSAREAWAFAKALSGTGRREGRG